MEFGQPQDIEWAIENGSLYLLQSRPITTLRNIPDPDGALNIWDNSNITESYNGVTSPLTFSFARSVYEGVYRQFCRILRVPQRKIEANDLTFRCMLGLIQGRIYYNLLNWYRVLALLPGFTVNRRFMEQMMGVRESLPDKDDSGTRQGDGAARVCRHLQSGGDDPGFDWESDDSGRPGQEILRAPAPSLAGTRSASYGDASR